MEKLLIKRNNDWWILLLEGLVMISLGIILLMYPREILTAIAYWFGVFVLVTGAVGIVWFFRNNEKKILHLVISVAVIITGILMITKLIATITAVTTVFVLITMIVSVVLIRSGWEERRSGSTRLLPVILAVIALAISIKGIVDTFSDTSVISHLIGKSILVAGGGLIVLAFLRMRTKDALNKKINSNGN
jgi:uncharacterized membrane protein HdeD (DUF308 family)